MAALSTGVGALSAGGSFPAADGVGRRPGRGLPGLWGVRRRPTRVLTLVIAAILLGLADLAITMTYLLNIGMFESNPVARLVINSGSPAMVVGFKLGTMLVTSWIVVATRRRWQAEAVAWISVAVLSVLFVHWLGYIEHAGVATNMMTVVAADPSYAAGEWVTLR
ncbi:MAG: DUF5658 family protein [Phycisphaerales bacterium]